MLQPQTHPFNTRTAVRPLGADIGVTYSQAPVYPYPGRQAASSTTRGSRDTIAPEGTIIIARQHSTPGFVATDAAVARNADVTAPSVPRAVPPEGGSVGTQFPP